jgi:hypothetical protein
MRAAWYEKQGPANEVLIVGEMPDPRPAAGEVRIRIAASGINPGDIKKREDSFGLGMPYPRVIPHTTAPVWSTWSVMAYWRNGSGDERGVMARSPIARSGRPQSLLLCRSTMSHRSPRTFLRKRALVLGFPVLRLIARSMSAVTSPDGRFLRS